MPEIAHLLRHEVTFRLKVDADTYGKPSFGRAYTVKALVEQGTGTFTDDNGKERRAEHSIFTLVEIPRGSRVWVPGKDPDDPNDGLEAATTRKATLADGTEIFEVLL